MSWNNMAFGGLAGTISSVSLFTPIVGGTAVILFAGMPGPLYWATHFDNSFLLLDNRSGDRWDVNLADVPWQDQSWDNCVSSLIVVHTAQGDEQRISCANSLTPKWNKLIDKQFAVAAGGVVTSVKRDGNPSWRWVAFPVGMEHLNSTRNYLQVYQNLNISLEDPLPDYKAYISYYLHLGAHNGSLTGYVRRWEYWVEDGLLSGYVEGVLRPYVLLGAAQLNDRLAGGLISASGQVQRVYYLPGDQRSSAAQGQTRVLQGWSGNPGGDATIVVQTA